jgi:drug/metabolite transporter (DMT)-like permease
MNTHRGIILAVLALGCWSLAPFCFTAVGRRIGPLATNMLRLALATLALGGIALARLWAGFAVPLPHPEAIAWLAASGVIGLTIGDAFLYRAFVTLGPGRTSQIQTLAPAATAAFAWLALGEILAGRQLAGMALILGGVLTATSGAVPARDGNAPLRHARREGRRPFALGDLKDGVWAAIWSALFQGAGTVLARQGFLSQADLDPLLATAIRVGAGTAGLWAFARSHGPWRPVLGAWNQKSTLRILLGGVVFGPTLGMLCYIAALKSAPAGIVTTITFMAPLLIIPIGARLYGTRIGWATLAGTALSLAGVTLLGLG